MSTVYILGAGASRFAGLPLSTKLWHFLQDGEDSNDIQQLEDIHFLKPFIKKMDYLLEHLESPDLELIITVAELAEPSGGVIGGFNLNDFDLIKIKSALGRLISARFLENSYDVFNPRPNRFQEIFDSWSKRFQNGDTIITFNWDTIHERILWDVKKWHFSSGYGFTPNNLKTQDFQMSDVLVLKLHGSANWGLERPEDTAPPAIDYLINTFPNSGLHDSNGTSDFGFSVVIPSYLKTPQDKPFLAKLWVQAAEKLQEAEKIIILGYSLPEPDGPARTLLTLALGKNENLQSILVVAGPSEGLMGFNPTYSRWDQFLSSINLRDKTKMIHKEFEVYIFQ